MTTDTDRIASAYLRFAETEADGVSPTYATWARGVAGDPALLAAVAALPERGQQPNLVFAAARLLGGAPGDLDSLADLLARRWRELEDVVSVRSTQTNEVGRCAALLPVLAALPQPLALLEVGAAAGLCLYPDRYSYTFTSDDGHERRVDPTDGPSAVRLECRLRGPHRPPIPVTVPRVVWRAGIDLDPVDVDDPDQTAWLQALVWPEQHARRERLRRALQVRRAEAPPTMVRGDLLDRLPALAARAPADATLVVLHSATLAYVDDAGLRAQFVELVGELPGRWVSNEGRRVLDIPLPADVGPATPDTLFTLALDGTALAVGQGHGASLTWLGE